MNPIRNKILRQKHIWITSAVPVELEFDPFDDVSGDVLECLCLNSKENMALDADQSQQGEQLLGKFKNTHRRRFLHL